MQYSAGQGGRYIGHRLLLLSACRMNIPLSTPKNTNRTRAVLQESGRAPGDRRDRTIHDSIFIRPLLATGRVR